MDFDACWESLSIFQPFFFFSDLLMFASRIYWDLIRSSLPSSPEMFPVPVAATRPQSMMEPPPDVTDTPTVLHGHLLASSSQPSQCEEWAWHWLTGLHHQDLHPGISLVIRPWKQKRGEHPPHHHYHHPPPWLEILSILLLKIETMALSCYYPL